MQNHYDNKVSVEEEESGESEEEDCGQDGQVRTQGEDSSCSPEL